MKYRSLISLLLAITMVCGMLSVAGAEQTVYTGSAAGFGGQEVTAEVTLEDGKVVALTVDDSTQSYQLNGVESIQPLVDAIIAAGGTEGVDAVSNATVTSTAVLTIVNDALAGGPVDYSNVEISYNPGTYTGTGHGRNGEIHVEVTFSADKIENITVLPNAETVGISDLPQKQVPADIIAYQSLAVDTITGATLTSNGVIDAVADAAEQAGAVVAALRAVPVDYPKQENADLSAQVVVAGGGMAGMMAAITAADQGADVVLVEKLPYVGGTLMLAAGGFVAANSEWMAQQEGITDDSTARHIAWVHEANKNSVRQPDYDFVEYLLDESGKTTDYLTGELGLEGVAVPGGDFPDRIMIGGSKFGAGFADDLKKQMEDKGVRIILNAAAQEILMEDGKAVGLRVSGKDGDFTVKADKVIIATGGATRDWDRMISVNPGLANTGLDDQTSAGNTGDGFRMMEEIGAQMGDGPYLKASLISFSPALRLTWATVPLLVDNMIFDANGMRFFNEATSFDPTGFTTGMTSEIARHGSPANYVLYDTHNIQDNVVTSTIDASTGEVPATLLDLLKAHADDPNVVVYGENIEEIARKLDIDSDVLTASYNRYQAACEKGFDADYGKDPDHLIAYNEEGGLYAVKVFPGAFGTVGGVLTDRQFHPLSQDGSSIENLFAVGEVATSTLFGDYYMGAFSLMYYSTAGRIAGETAVAEINAQ